MMISEKVKRSDVLEWKQKKVCNYICLGGQQTENKCCFVVIVFFFRCWKNFLLFISFLYVIFQGLLWFCLVIVCCEDLVFISLWQYLTTINTLTPGIVKTNLEISRRLFFTVSCKNIKQYLPIFATFVLFTIRPRMFWFWLPRELIINIIATSEKEELFKSSGYFIFCMVAPTC